jgi:hypothetical protein
LADWVSRQLMPPRLILGQVTQGQQPTLHQIPPFRVAHSTRILLALYLSLTRLKRSPVPERSASSSNSEHVLKCSRLRRIKSMRKTQRSRGDARHLWASRCPFPFAILGPVAVEGAQRSRVCAMSVLRQKRWVDGDPNGFFVLALC